MVMLVIWVAIAPIYDVTVMDLLWFVVDADITHIPLGYFTGTINISYDRLCRQFDAYLLPKQMTTYDQPNLME